MSGQPARGLARQGQGRECVGGKEEAEDLLLLLLCCCVVVEMSIATGEGGEGATGIWSPGRCYVKSEKGATGKGERAIRKKEVERGGEAEMDGDEGGRWSGNEGWR